MQIIFRTLTGTSYSLDVENNITIKELKKLIRLKVGISKGEEITITRFDLPTIKDEDMLIVEDKSSPPYFQTETKKVILTGSGFFMLSRAEQEPRAEQESRVKQELQEKSKLHEHRINDLKCFINHLSILGDKKRELKTRKCDEAYLAAKTLHSALISLKEKYCEGTINLKDFKICALKAIDASRSKLEEHRGCKEILDNIILSIVSLVKYLFTGSFFKFNTDSANKLNDLQKSIVEIAPVAV